MGFALRVYQLGALGFSEDESFKILAVGKYLEGDFTVNAEHPMLLKNLVLISEQTAKWWNRNENEQISEEAALRFPNALVGSLTVFPLFLLARSFYGRKVGILCAALWASGIGAVSFNRIGKEDTLLVFFTLFAFYFYRRAKMTGDKDEKKRDRFYRLSGLSFGLQLASKYILGYLALIVLYYHRLGLDYQNQPIPGKTLAKFFASMGITFLLANPVSLFPSTWHYIVQYLSQKYVQHHGYQFMGQVYSNNLSNTPFGSPFYFYIIYFLTKTPLVVLSLAVIGFTNAFFVRRGAGRTFLRFMVLWLLIPLSFAGGKWLRYGFAFIPYFYMAAAVGFTLLWRRIRKISFPHLATTSACILVILLWMGVFKTLPMPLLFVNQLGGGAASAGKYFTPEEFNDAGFREMYLYLAKNADKNSFIATDEQAIFDHYSRMLGRNDLNRIPINAQDFTHGECYVIAHEGNRFFENDPVVQYLKAHKKPITIFETHNLTIARLYKVDSREWRHTTTSLTGSMTKMKQPEVLLLFH